MASLKKGQNLTCKIGSKTKDEFGIWEIEIFINGNLYTYPITSEFAVRKVESLLRRHKPGKALHVLSLFTVPGFNAFKEGASNASKS
jgi:hypothetical protein